MYVFAHRAIQHILGNREVITLGLILNCLLCSENIYKADSRLMNIKY